MAQKLFFTSDHHFGHDRIIEYCSRPFPDMWAMNEAMIVRWNEVVDIDDTIYHLGDFSWKNPSMAAAILARLNGNKYLCIGSHDKHMLKLARFFVDIRESFMINISNTQLVFMNHYLHKTWPRSHHGTWHLFGHSHGRMNTYAAGEGKLLDVGVDTHNFRPWSLSEIIEVMESRPLNFNDRRRHMAHGGTIRKR